jgi:type IV pilus assembly protein PilC
VSGELTVRSRNDLLAQLRKKKIIVTSVRTKPKEVNIKLPFLDGITTKDQAVFTRQFATMINAGLPLVQCLDILSRQLEKQNFRDITKKVMNDIEGGSTLTESMAKHPKCWDELYVNMVNAGETGGILDTILLRLATFLEKNDALIRKIKGAMVYPAVIMTVAVGAVAVLLIFVIPTFQTMFDSAGIPLPLPTRIVIGMSEFLTGYWYAILAAIGGLIFAIRRYYGTLSGRKRIDAALLSSPVLGDLLRKSAVSRFTRTLGTLISSGVSILEGLEITAKTAGNMVVHDAVMASRQSIAGGETIAAPLERSKVFPPMVISMIAVGEQTGGLDEMLSKIADFYDEEVDVAVSTLLSLMEPVMIVILGVVVGGMVVAMYLPIFDMMNAVQ